MKKKLQIIFRVTSAERDYIFRQAKKVATLDGRPMSVSAYIRSLIFGPGEKVPRPRLPIVRRKPLE